MCGLSSQITAQMISSERQCDLSSGQQTFFGKGLTVLFVWLVGFAGQMVSSTTMQLSWMGWCGHVPIKLYL